jgi:hypothetical protein
MWSDINFRDNWQGEHRNVLIVNIYLIKSLAQHIYTYFSLIILAH